MLVEIGMWGGGFGPDVISTLLFLLFLAHGFTFDGASANPTVSFQEFLLRDGPFIDTIVKLLAQYAGMEAARFLSKQYWMLEFTEFHTIQMMMADDCSPSLQASIPQGIFVEALCAFCYHFVLLRFQNSRPVYRIPTVALTVTLLAYAGKCLISVFFKLSKKLVSVHIKVRCQQILGFCRWYRFKMRLRFSQGQVIFN